MHHHQQNLSQALTSALANPYPQYSSHYIQALSKVTHPSTTPDGYTLSSTYTPEHTRYQMPEQKPRNQRPAVPQPRQFGSWYQSGNCRCTYQGCYFVGSQKSVEIHMMDRHLIYPPGWEKRKKKPEWDADPSLKGKQIPIQGTNIILDTPEALEAWVTERKKRWPTAERVAEKKRKLEEAIERGQIIPQDSSFPRKRPRPGYKQEVRVKRFGSSRLPQEQNGKQQGRLTSHTAQVVSSSSVRPAASEDRESASSEDSDAPPEVMTSKPSAIVDSQEKPLPKDVEGQSKFKTFQKRSAKGPKKPPHNPFASRATLLRNLLLPEIRMTISNLSQSVRFLVDNDFLDGVELTPGEVEGKLIQVLDQSGSNSPP